MLSTFLDFLLPSCTAHQLTWGLGVIGIAVATAVNPKTSLPLLNLHRSQAGRGQLSILLFSSWISLFPPDVPQIYVLESAILLTNLHPIPSYDSSWTAPHIYIYTPSFLMQITHLKIFKIFYHRDSDILWPRTKIYNWHLAASSSLVTWLGLCAAVARAFVCL